VLGRIRSTFGKRLRFVIARSTASRELAEWLLLAE
jgi:hypothetical protein